MHSGSFLSLVQTLARKAYFVIVSTIASPLQFFRRPHQKIQRLALAELTVERLSAFVSSPYLISSCRHGQVLINKSHVEVCEWLLCVPSRTVGSTQHRDLESSQTFQSQTAFLLGSRLLTPYCLSPLFRTCTVDLFEDFFIPILPAPLAFGHRLGEQFSVEKKS